jgi:hypothetical protein
VRRKAASGKAIPKEKALLVIRWQSVQWHVVTNSGASVISDFTALAAADLRKLHLANLPSGWRKPLQPRLSSTASCKVV